MAETAAQKKARLAKQKAKYAEYGYVVDFLNAHKDVKAKVDAAIKGGWTPQRLEGEIKNTNWWKTRTDSQRKYDLLSKEQPGEIKRQVDAAQSTILSQAEAMGVTITATKAKEYALQAVRDGKSQQEITLALANSFKFPTAPSDGGPAVEKGQAGVIATQIRDMASAYGVSVKDADLLSMTQKVLGGAADPQAFEDTFRESAKALYSPIADILDKGTTLRQFVDPYLNIASQQLGISAEMMNLADTKWTGMIQQGKVLTADEWTRTLRTDPTYEWNKTEGAKREAMGLVSALGAMFGSA
jgi:hypothetical protein